MTPWFVSPYEDFLALLFPAKFLWTLEEYQRESPRPYWSDYRQQIVKPRVRVPMGREVLT